MCVPQSNILNQVQVSREDNQYVVTATMRWKVEVADEQAPDQLQRQVDRMGQQIKREVYGQILQEVEQRITAQFQMANPSLQRRGCRSYTLVAPFGKVQIQRSRLYDRQAQTWSVPAQQVWQTPARHCLLPGLKEAACDHVQSLSVRKTVQALDEEAGVCKLICPATVVKLFHQEGRQLDQRQRAQAEAILERHPKALSNGLAGALEGAATAAAAPSQAAAPGPAKTPAGAGRRRRPSRPERSEEDPSQENPPPLSEEQLEQVRQRAIGFLCGASADLGERTCDPHGGAVASADPDAADPSTPLDAAPERAPERRSRATRSVDEGWVVLQPDEVQTKAQAGESGKRNTTFTATVHVEDRTYYLAACCAATLWRLAAAVLCRLGVPEGARGLLVIGDGALWIRDWFLGIHLPKQEMVLCWYHLTKRVYERLSQGGFSKARRQELEHLVLGHLWKGELAQAVWVLWGIRQEARHGQWITQLIHYLLARREYLPDYSARHRAGLWIASTRVEKWNDWAVSDRCKRRGMSWTAEGVLALALHQAQSRNDPALWDPATSLIQAA